MSDFPLQTDFVMAGAATSREIAIWMAGDEPAVRTAVRDFCNREGLCVTVTAALYVYTGGAEDGFRIGIINYPRYPSDDDALWCVARRLAKHVARRCHQSSYSIQGPQRTEWWSRRLDAKAAQA